MAWQVILLYIVWIIYTLIEGFREAFYWHFKIRSNYTNKLIDIHPFFFIQRSIVATLIAIFSNIFICNDRSLLFFIAMSICFPFFHSGIYYLTRNRLDNSVYKSTWLDHSTNCDSRLTPAIKPIYRIGFLIISLAILIYII